MNNEHEIIIEQTSIQKPKHLLKQHYDKLNQDEFSKKFDELKVFRITYVRGRKKRIIINMFQKRINAQKVDSKMKMTSENLFTLPQEYNVKSTNEGFVFIERNKAKQMKQHNRLEREKFYNKLIFFNKNILFTLIMLLQLIIMMTNIISIDAILVDSAPRITIQPNDLIAIEGESTELNCDAEGQPEPMIEWYHNGQLIKTSTQSRTTMGGSIQFLDIRSTLVTTTSSAHQAVSKQQQAPTDTGIYYCLARNSLGIAKSRNASLQVACKYILNKETFLSLSIDFFFSFLFFYCPN